LLLHRLATEREKIEMTTIAAVIPLHNKAGFIERALLSALAQTRALDEIVVVDDASTDGGMDVVARLAAAHPAAPFRVLARPEPGPGGYAARNLAIASAQSRWIAFLDADDEWAPRHIETLAGLLSAHDVGAVGASRCVVRGEVKNTRYATLNAQDEIVGFSDFIRVWLMRKDCPFWTSATAVRRDILFQAGLFPADRCRRGGDKDLWLRVMRHTSALLTREVGATYHNDDVRQVTRTEATHTEHCIVPTLERLIAEESGETRRRLIRLLNMEISQYAKFALGHAPIAPGAFRAFRAEADPLAYLLLLSAAHTPVSWIRLVRAAVKRRRDAAARNPCAGC
jgi:glycosyltransferase involved in cell wall biosynthesis